MPGRDPMNWMLSEAIEQLSRAERMHRQFFSLTATAEPRGSTWEPPIDVIETDDEGMHDCTADRGDKHRCPHPCLGSSVVTDEETAETMAKSIGAKRFFGLGE